MGDKKEPIETEKIEMSPMNVTTDGERGERGERGEERLSIDGGDNEPIIPVNTENLSSENHKVRMETDQFVCLG